MKRYTNSAPKTHNVVKIKRNRSWLSEYFCRNCQKSLDQHEVNKRCKGAKR